VTFCATADACVVNVIKICLNFVCASSAIVHLMCLVHITCPMLLPLSFNHCCFIATLLLFNFCLLQIKRLDPVTKKVTTIAGTGRAGYKDGPALSAQVRDHLTSFCCLQCFLYAMLIN
jgi:hypothetical protein